MSSKNTGKKVLIVVYSYHHMNTEKIANTIADVLCADIKHPQDFSFEKINEYDIIGFGAGIDSGKHYAPILELASMLPNTNEKKRLYSPLVQLRVKRILSITTAHCAKYYYQKDLS